MAEVSAQLVKALREKTGAGVLDCKKALEHSNGDIEKAVEYLRQKGLASAEKKAGRSTTEGLIYSYIHTGGKLGVLLELNCETDFVARGEVFQNLAHNLALQIAATENVEYVDMSEVPPEVIERERAIEMGREDLANKPEAVREKIVQGRLDKLFKERCLLDQPYIKDPSITVRDLIKQTIALVGENIRVRRFTRYRLGEELAKPVAAPATQPTPEPVATAAPEPAAEPAPPATEKKKSSSRKTK
ncbi:MAG: translation elongation factor Ts [Gloeomargarita sp. SKYBB_i_bin120]|nr:translation elongation factor Ts [Gloeomargarita sp. SKYG98]MCS7291417.1 translation elongation factor Ts [Gloeomargarita sp. SKYB120]MDW8176977.1 translation elongation factor Ts [Gloeomargarita sp. SKYBB_i_bin120]